jgi:soluble cytochrome b562
MTLKRTWILPIAITALLLVPSLRAAEEVKETKETTAAKPPVPFSAVPVADADAMEKAMKEIDRIHKLLPRRVKDAKKNAESLAMLAEMQKQTIVAKSLPPSNFESKPAAEQAQYIADYRLGMIQLLRQIIDAEEQILKGQHDQATKTVKGLVDLEREGHKKFQPPHEEEKK